MGNPYQPAPTKCLLCNYTDKVDLSLGLLQKTLHLDIKTIVSPCRRKELNLRTISQVLSSILAKHGKEYARATVANAVQRPDER